MGLEGVFIPTVTPFDQRGDIVPDALRRLIRVWLGSGVSGLVVNASTGEGPFLSRGEQITLIELVLDEVGERAMVIAGTGAIGTRETIDLTRDAKECGAEAALVVTPYFFKPSDDELYQHYASIMDSVDINVILYNVPKFTGYSIRPSVIERIAKECSGLIGVKDSSGDIGLIAEIARIVEKRVSVLSGSADVFLPTLSLGGKGAILAVANVVPEMCVELYNAFKNGDHSKAGRLQLEASFANKILVKNHSQIAAIKAAMNRKGWYAGYPRRPLRPLPENEEKEVAEALKSAGIL